MAEPTLVEEGATVIQFRTDGELELIPKRIDFGVTCLGGRGCKNVYVNERERTCECRKCGRTIDPFDYLWRLATDGAYLMDGLKSLREDIRLRTAELGDLKRQISNAKVTLKRLPRDQHADTPC